MAGWIEAEVGLHAVWHAVPQSGGGLRKAAPWYRRASLLGFQEDLRRLRCGDILVHFGRIFGLLGVLGALGALLARLGGLLGHLGGILRHLGAVLAHRTPS